MLCESLQLHGIASMPTTVPALMHPIDAWLLSGAQVACCKGAHPSSLHVF
jgi:hypothetical protein